MPQRLEPLQLPRSSRPSHVPRWSLRAQRPGHQDRDHRVLQVRGTRRGWRAWTRILGERNGRKQARRGGWGLPKTNTDLEVVAGGVREGIPFLKVDPGMMDLGPPTQRTKLWGCPPLPSFLGPLKDAPACLQLSLHSQLQGNPWIADTCQWGAATGRTFWGASFGAPQTDPFSLCVVFSPPSPQEPAGSGHFLQV